MRLFVALEVPDEIQRTVDRAVAPFRERHPDLRWTRPTSWHLTLAFLGEVDPVPVGLPAALVVAASEAPTSIRLRLASPGRFGDRVLWLGVDDEPAGAVAALGERLQAAAADLGIAVDRKPVRPHLTLARAGGRGGPVSSAIVRDCPSVDAAWDARRAVLYRSRLGGGPARYEVIAPLELGAGGGSAS